MLAIRRLAQLHGVFPETAAVNLQYRNPPPPPPSPQRPCITATMQVVPAAITTACCCCCHCSKNYLLYAQITILLRHSTGLKFIVLILEIILLEGDHLLKHLVHVLALSHDLHVAFTKVCNLAHSPNGHIPEHHGGGLVLGHVLHATVPPGVLEGQHCPHPLQAVRQGGVDHPLTEGVPSDVQPVVPPPYVEHPCTPPGSKSFTISHHVKEQHRVHLVVSSHPPVIDKLQEDRAGQSIPPQRSLELPLVAH